ncbi:Trophinin [Manis pentadactyla]|nr:Trophinin [Manis pentadactyla]
MLKCGRGLDFRPDWQTESLVQTHILALSSLQLKWPVKAVPRKNKPRESREEGNGI